MKRSTLLSLAVVGGLCALGLDTTVATAAPQPPRPLVRILPLGDSITAGAGSSHAAGYRAHLWDLMAGQSRFTPDFVGSGSGGSVADPDNEGHPGYTVDQIRTNIDRWQTSADPDVILLHLGINDLTWNHISPADTARSFSTLVDRIVANRPSVTIVVQGLLPDTTGLASEIEHVNTYVSDQAAARRARGERILYVPPPRLEAAELPDQLHPNDSGYRKMAESFYGGLEQAVTNGWTVRPPAPRAGSENGGSGAARWADFDGDGRLDLMTIADNGEVRARLNRGGDPAGAAGWKDRGLVAGGITNERGRVRLVDFDGDGKADYVVIGPDGSVNVWLNRGGDNGGGWQGIGRVAGGTTNQHEQVRFADFDGDGRADYLTIADNGAVQAYLNRGGDIGGGWFGIGQVAGGTTADRTRVRLADNDGDGRADYWTVAPDGSITAYLNRGGDAHGGWRPVGQIATGVTTDHNQVHIADFDGDSHADYLVAGPNGSLTGYLFNGGDPNGGWTYIGTVAGGA
ncbi:FG-GAP-like repeat-containing protein [Streptomyces sp. NPDC051183]|uniref:FG-GAP-like repeat-containing protein n=1 Tax=unclassified Streptomyces TaxID=2593676 RepID=UPI003420706F